MKLRLGFAAALLVLAAALAAAQGTVSYKVDGRPFRFQDARLEYHPADGYFSLDCERQETVTMGDGSKWETVVGMTIQLAGDPKAFVGLHEASSPDEMPVYFSWYRLEEEQILEYLASLDSGDPARMKMTLKIDAFGGPGQLVRGSFRGTLFDEYGEAHTIGDGVFSVTRTDVTE
jgi:hypothetical protein